MFDGVVISARSGSTSREPEIFHIGAEQIGLAPEECVFVDDLRRTATAPRRSG